MKKVFKYAYIALIGAMAFTASSCSSDYEYEGRGAADDSNKAQAYIEGATAATKFMEVEPGNEAFTVTIARKNVNGASTVGIAKIDTAGVFNVPESVTFASGATTAELTVTPNSNIVAGKSYGLAVKIADADKSNYIDAPQTFVVDYTILKWESLGTCYWVDGIVSSLFGVDETLAYVTECFKTTTADGDRYRFALPYSHVATGNDGIGYIGYVYNDPGDCDEQEHLAVVDIVAGKGPLLRAMDLGMAWSYGAFSIKPLAYGKLTKDALIFPDGSLQLTMADWGSRATSMPCYLFFSADAYLTWLEEYTAE